VEAGAFMASGDTAGARSRLEALQANFPDSGRLKRRLDAESGGPSLVAASANIGGFLERSSDGVPGKPFDASNRRDADALDSESDHGGQH